MSVPSILLDGVAPPAFGPTGQSGANATATKTINTTSTVTVATSSLGVINSFNWQVTTKPVGSTCAVTQAPGYPFSTSLGPFDKAGGYVIVGIPNGDPSSAVFFAVTVATVVAGSLSTVVDANAKAVLTSLIAALANLGLVTNSTT